MKIGTKSVLFGAHALWFHPFCVALAWWKLYGFPWNPRLWFAFFLHDLGYIGMPNMDGPEGETHPEFGAGIMFRLFGYNWYLFTLLHSRYYTKLYPAFEPSVLCWADKLGVALEPWWFYLLRVKLTGEIDEYRAIPKHENDSGISSAVGDKAWVLAAQVYLRRVAYDGALRASTSKENNRFNPPLRWSSPALEGNGSG